VVEIFEALTVKRKMEEANRQFQAAIHGIEIK